MKIRRNVAFVMVVAVLLTFSPSADKTPVLAGASASPTLPGHSDQPSSAMIKEAYGKLPLSFEANQGQFDSQVQFVSRGAGNTTYLTSTEAVLRLADTQRSESTAPSAGIITPDRQRLAKTGTDSATLRMRLVGGNRAAQVTGLDELPGKSNYFIGNDPKKWRVNVPTYAKVKYEQVYRGVDLVYYGNQRQLEYDLIVAPGADPGEIRLAFEGTGDPSIERNGDLRFDSSARSISLHRPVVYQDRGGVRKQIAAGYRALRNGEYRFEIGKYDKQRPLIIDPQLSYSTLLGGSSSETGNSIAVDSMGNAYVAGYTPSADFPIAGAFQQTLNGTYDAFVTKLNSTGTALVYSTFLGGSANDLASRIALDAAGNAYVVGATRSSNFPLMNPIQPAFGGGGDPFGFSGDAFVTKIGASGSTLVYSTYLGGSSAEFGNGIAVDSQGSAYVTGSTSSINFPLAKPFQPARSPTSTDAFVSKLNPGGTALVFSTYFGGGGFDAGIAIAVDANGNACVAGTTSSRDLPILNSLQTPFTGSNAFRSSNSGQAWASIGEGLPQDATVNVIALDPHNSSTVYAATSGGLFKSLNAGTNWSAINTGLINGNQIKAIAIDPATSSTLFVGNQTGIFKSTNGGNNWAINFTNPVIPTFIATLVIDPLVPSTLYAGGSNNNGVFKSTDSGETWNFSSSGLGAHPAFSLAINPVNPSRLYLGSNDGVYRSFDSGHSWGPAFVIGVDVRQVAVDPVTPATVYGLASSGNVPIKSTDSGSNWTVIATTGLPHPINTLVIDPLTSSTLYAGTRQGIFKSADGGDSWLAANNGLNSPYVNALAIGTKDPSTLYAGTSTSFDAFVTKFTSLGTQLLFSTYLGGGFDDNVTDIALDATGNIHLSGWTNSLNFPTANPLQATLRGSTDAFVVKIAAGGSFLLYSTYFGGSGSDLGYGIAVDSGGNTYIAGGTGSVDFPSVNPVQPALSGSEDAFIARLSPDGNTVVFATFLGGTFGENARDIAIDASGNCYVTGHTESSDFPVTSGAFQTGNHGFDDVFIAKIAGVALFDFCLQDDKSGSTFRLNSSTGDYQFDSCDGVALTGTATAVQKGCRLTIQGDAPDRSVFARVSTCSNTGNASIQILSQGTTYTITDSNITNNTCSCAGSPGLKR